MKTATAKRREDRPMSDRRKVLAAIHSEQAFIDAQEAVKTADRVTDLTHGKMVEGKDLKELRGLNKVFRELRPSFKGSQAFQNCRNFLRGTIEDYTSGRMKQNAPDPTPGKMEDRGQAAKA